MDIKFNIDPSKIKLIPISWKTNDIFPQQGDTILVWSKKHNLFEEMIFIDFYDESEEDHQLQFKHKPYCIDKDQNIKVLWSDVDYWIYVEEI